MAPQHKPPVPRSVALPLPPIVPADAAGTTPRSPWDLTITNGSVLTGLRVVRTMNGQIDAAGTPVFSEGSAPALSDSLNTDTAEGGISYATVPPEQGKTSVAIDFSRGISQDPLGNYKRGYYGWAESMWTIDTGGLAVRAPNLVTVPYAGGVAALTHRVESMTIHNFTSGGHDHSTVWFAAGSKVYWLDEFNNLAINESPTQPASAQVITAITSFAGVLVVGYGTLDNYAWSSDHGVTWRVGVLATMPALTLSTLDVNGVLLDNTIYNVSVAAVDQFGNQSLVSSGAQLTNSPGNISAIRVAFTTPSPLPVSYRVYLSAATLGVAKFVGTVLETQRAGGGSAIDSQGAQAIAFGLAPAGSFDVHLAGIGGVPTPTSVQSQAKFFADYHESQILNNPAVPVLVMSNDPNFVYSTQDPRNPGAWNTGSLAGPGSLPNADFMTGLTIAPTGELLVGKTTHLYQLESAADATLQAGASVRGDVAVRMGPVAASLGTGLPTPTNQLNFANGAPIGFKVYFTVKDFDVAEFSPKRLSLSFGTTLLVPTIGLGPAFKCPAIPEMQRAVTALASDNQRLLFAALDGTEGYVIVGKGDTEAQDKGWEWHGSVARNNFQVHYMWTANFPLSANFKDVFVFMSRSDSPYTINYMRVPRTNILQDPGMVSCVNVGSIRFGKDYAGQEQVKKVISRVTPRSRALNNATPNLTLGYRTADGASFTALGTTFTTSPLPVSQADLLGTYLPAGVSGTFVEFQVTITGGVFSYAAAVESIEYELFRRPLRKDLITCTVYADNSGMTREGGRRGSSWAQLRRELYNARDALTPPLLTETGTGIQWTVDLQQVTRRWMPDPQANANGDGSGAAMVVDLVMQELDTKTAPASVLQP